MKKTIDYYMGLPYRMEIIPDKEEGGFTVCFPELPGCLTCAETLEAAVSNANEAKRAWLQAALEDGIEVTEPGDSLSLEDYSGQFKLRLPKSLHRALSVNAKKEGVSMNQYCIYLLSRNDASHMAGKAS